MPATTGRWSSAREWLRNTFGVCHVATVWRCCLQTVYLSFRDRWTVDIFWRSLSDWLACDDPNYQILSVARVSASRCSTPVTTGDVYRLHAAIAAILTLYTVSLSQRWTDQMDSSDKGVVLTSRNCHVPTSGRARSDFRFFTNSLQFSSIRSLFSIM